ncbi:MAG: BatD family protein [Desulfuromonadaceae bacterium]|nr:BatD family protein [Desulfuromonadaceae bacterium]
MVAFLQRLLLVCLVINGSAAPLWALTIDARLDRNPVAVNESLTLTFSATESPAADPDFSPLQRDFEILSQNRSSQLSIINGDVQKKTEWILTLMAKRAGRMTIPPISFGSDRSRGLTVDVVSAATSQARGANRQIELQVEIDKQQLTVREQLLLTVRLLRAVNLSAATLTEPEIPELDCLVQKLGDDRDYEKLIDGVRYVVTERRYALFPQQSGTLRIAPLTFEGRIVERSVNRFDPFGAAAPVVRQQSREQQVTVVPAALTNGTDWLPAQAVELQEEWSTDPLKLKIGEPVTRTIILRAVGQSSAQLPSLPPPDVTNLKIYPDQPALTDTVSPQGMVALRTEKYALVPTRSGRLRLPPMEVVWWDTTTGQQRSAHLPGRDLLVAAPVAAPVATAEKPPVSPATAIPAAGSSNETFDGIEDRFIPWPWWSLLCAGLAAGLIIVLVLLFRRRNPEKELPVEAPRKNLQSEEKLFKQLLSVAANNDPLRVRDALIAWGRAHFELAALASLGRIADTCPAPLKDRIRELQEHIYGHNSINWRSEELMKALSQYNSEPKPSRKKLEPNGIAELYPK